MQENVQGLGGDKVGHRQERLGEDGVSGAGTFRQQGWNRAQAGNAEGTAASLRVQSGAAFQAVPQSPASAASG